MSHQTLIATLLITAAVIALAVWFWLIVLPAWKSYGRPWERVVAAILCIYVLAALTLAGAGLSGIILWYYDQV